MNEEMIAKAKETKSVEELIALAKENDIEITEEHAKEYFDQLHAATGELTDDELDNVVGGGCKHNGYTVVTSLCDCFNHKYFPGCYMSQGKIHFLRKDNLDLRRAWFSELSGCIGQCGSCYNLEFSGGIGLCGVSK